MKNSFCKGAERLKIKSSGLMLLFVALAVYLVGTFLSTIASGLPISTHSEIFAVVLIMCLTAHLISNDKEAKRIKERIAEVGGITDLAVLAEIAKDDEDEEVRQAAAIHLLSLKVDELERAARGL